MSLRRAFGFGAFALLSCGGRSGLLELTVPGVGGAPLVAAGGATATGGTFDGGAPVPIGGTASAAGANMAVAGHALGGNVSNGGAVSSAGSTAIGPWTTLSHQDPPLPHDNPFDFTGFPTAYTDVWSDDADSALIATATPGYKAPSSGSVGRFQGGAFVGFATGPEHLYKPPQIAGLSLSDLWLAEDYYGLEHSDGTSWSLHAPKAVLVWENAANDVWACTSSTSTDNTKSYRLSHWDGGDWREIAIPLPAGFSPSRLWSNSATEVFVVGSAGPLLRWTGTDFEPRECPGVSGWNAVWGVTDAIWTVGNGGAVARWQGDTCELLPTQALLGDTRALSDIWGSGPDNLWIIGEAGTILRWRGSALEIEPAGLNEGLNAVWGVASGVVWAVGNNQTILRRTF